MSLTKSDLQAIEAVIEPTVERVVDRLLEPTVEKVVDRLLEPTIERVVERLLEPAVEKVVGRLLEPTIERVVVRVVQPMIDELAQSTANGFAEVHARLDSVEERLMLVEDDTRRLRGNIMGLQRKVNA